MYTHVNFTRANKMETRCEVLCVNVKLIEVQLLLLRAIFQILPLLVANVSFTDARTYVLRMAYGGFGSLWKISSYVPESGRLKVFHFL